MRAIKVESGVVTAAIKVKDSDSIPVGFIADPSKTGNGYTDNGDGSFSAPPGNVVALSAKEVRDAALEALEYDFGDGRVMQVRPRDEQNVRNAIEIMTANGIPVIGWVMKDNAKHTVTATELQTALTAGQLAAMAIWDNYTPE